MIRYLPNGVALWQLREVGGRPSTSSRHLQNNFDSASSNFVLQFMFTVLSLAWAQTINYRLDNDDI